MSAVCAPDWEAELSEYFTEPPPAIPWSIEVAEQVEEDLDGLRRAIRFSQKRDIRRGPEYARTGSV